MDEIAYNTADLDDAFEAKLVSLEEVMDGISKFAEFYREVDAKFPQGRKKLKFNEALKRVLNFLATDLVETTRRNAADAGVKSVEDVCGARSRLAAFSAGSCRRESPVEAISLSKFV